jgi:hypothetical protein
MNKQQSISLDQDRIVYFYQCQLKFETEKTPRVSKVVFTILLSSLFAIAATRHVRPC